MSDKPPSDPFEQLPKQIQELLKGSNVKSFYSPPMPATGGAAEDVADETDEKHQTTLRRIREFNLKPREIRDYLDRKRHV